MVDISRAPLLAIRPDSEQMWLIGERQHSFRLRGQFALSNATNVKCFIGFVNDTANFRSGANPLDVLHGIGMWVDSANSANFSIAQNDGVATTVHTDWSTPTVLDTNTHSFDITRIMPILDLQWISMDRLPSIKRLKSRQLCTELALQCWVETGTTALREVKIAYLVFEGPAPSYNINRHKVKLVLLKLVIVNGCSSRYVSASTSAGTNTVLFSTFCQS